MKLSRQVIIQDHLEIKIGQEYNQKLEELSSRLLLSKEETIEYCIKRASNVMPLQGYICKSCGKKYQSANPMEYCSYCE